MTALVSAFARAYHFQNECVRVFEDSVAKRLLGETYGQIAEHMTAGVQWFEPGFSGTEEEALQRIVNKRLAPTPLARAAFAERALRQAVCCGAKQYLILGAGYDTFAYRQSTWARELQIFELDQQAVQQEKRRRLEQAGILLPDNVHFIGADLGREGWMESLCAQETFGCREITFCSALGLSYYLLPQAFETLLGRLMAILPEGSAVAFDYPEEERATGPQTGQQRKLAAAAGETMRANYRRGEMEERLARQGLLLYEQLGPEEIDRRFFARYNLFSPDRSMKAVEGVSFALAVKKQMGPAGCGLEGFLQK